MWNGWIDAYSTEEGAMFCRLGSSYAYAFASNESLVGAYLRQIISYASWNFVRI